MKKEKLIELGLDEALALKCLEMFKSESDLQKQPNNNNEKYKEEINKLKGELKEKEEAHSKEVHNIKVHTALEKALTGANVINQKALKPFLDDFDKAEFTEDGTIKGLSEKLQELMNGEETGFLFKKDEPIQAPVEEIKPPILQGVKTGESGNEIFDKPVDFAKMKYSEMTKYLEENPNVTID